jgi:alkylation response protein AidB-like acyl-CoA dehydrogenase
MNFAPSAEQTEIRRAARRFLATHCASAQVRAAMESERGYDAEAWSRAARELGWTAIAVPETFGGAGLGWAEVATVAEEIGRANACLPFLSTACLATAALLARPDSAAAGAYLPRLAAGEILGALAFAESAHVDPSDVSTVAVEGSDGWVLSGTKLFVVDGDAADVLLVTARAPGTSGEHGVAVFAVDARSPGVQRERVPALDPTRPLAVVTLRDVRAARDALVGPAPVLHRALDVGAVVLAAEHLGGAERCLEMATDYAKARVQFDRPIGSFQAIKHRLSDMLTAVETARSAAIWAASVAASGDEDGTSPAPPERGRNLDELPVAASIAKSYCAEAFFRCAAECLQVHGGIGFTWEHDVHLFLRRARSSLTLFGSPSRDRERVAQHLGLGAPCS